MNYLKSEEILPACNMSVGLPKNFNPTDSVYNNMATEWGAIRPLSYYTFTEGVSVSQLGIVFDKLRVFPKSDISIEHKNRMLFRTKHLLANYLKKKVDLSTQDHYVVAHDTNYQGYYHWLLETLPRLFVAKDFLNDKILLIPSDIKHFHHATIKLFDFKAVHQINHDEYVRVQYLTLVPHVGSKAQFRTGLLQQMREYLLGRIVGKTNPPALHRIFVSRKKSNRRYLLNEIDVQEVVKRHGFNIVYLEDLDWIEQVKLFAHTSILVTVHGAALANVIFMPLGSAFMEFRSATQEGFGLSYYRLSSCLGSHYYYQMCTPSLPKDYINTDLMVDIEVLENNLRLIIKNSSNK